MSAYQIAQLLIAYRYWILIPLALIEGPIVAFVSGTLASLGYFNLYELAAFFFARDMAMDALYYYSGYFGSRTAFVKKMLIKLHIKAGELEKLRQLWEKHPARTMFIGKLSYGIAQAFIVAAGVVKMNIKKFFGYGALVAVAQYGVLLFWGYFFGNAFGGNVSSIVDNIQYVITAAAFIISGYYIFRWHVSSHFPGRP